MRRQRGSATASAPDGTPVAPPPGAGENATSPAGLHDALVISYAAVSWGSVTGVASVVVGLQSVSTALIGTGAGILADVLSSLALIWRFRAERAGRPEPERLEHRAQLAAGTALLLVAVGIAAAAALRLSSGTRAHTDAAAIALATATVLVLPLLAWRKYVVAPTVPSHALRIDAHISVVGASTGAVTLLGLALTAAFGWARADASAALVIAAIAGTTSIRELRAAGTHPSAD